MSHQDKRVGFHNMEDSQREMLLQDYETQIAGFRLGSGIGGPSSRGIEVAAQQGGIDTNWGSGEEK